MKRGKVRRNAFCGKRGRKPASPSPPSQFRGLVTFSQAGFGTEYMCLYTADGFTGELRDCDEGRLEWVKKSELGGLNLWDGDRIFLDLLAGGAPFFSLKLRYEGDSLREAVLDGRPLPDKVQKG